MSGIGAVILCAGTGSRFGSDKLELVLAGRRIWEWSVMAFLRHPEVSEVVVVTQETKLAEYQAVFPDIKFVPGGLTRSESSKAGVEALSSHLEFALVHDGARPNVSRDLIGRVVEEVRVLGAVVPCLLVTDTIKELREDRVVTLDRSTLRSVQTPQAARRKDLIRALAGEVEGTDDASLLEAIGIFPTLIEGDRRNLKVTTQEDFELLEGLVGAERETRTGFGYDIHAFSDDPARTLWLGGVAFDGARALDGHSDADVLLHAVVDALLGAAGLGDIGQLFPNDDPRWKNMASSHFLREAGDRLRAQHWQIANIDATVVAETPKIMVRSSEIRERIADTLGLAVEVVSVKATTNEKLGSLGRSEGIAATAVVTIQRNKRTGERT